MGKDTTSVQFFRAHQLPPGKHTRRESRELATWLWVTWRSDGKWWLSTDAEIERAQRDGYHKCLFSDFSAENQLDEPPSDTEQEPFGIGDEFCHAQVQKAIDVQSLKLLRPYFADLSPSRISAILIEHAGTISASDAVALCPYVEEEHISLFSGVYGHCKSPTEGTIRNVLFYPDESVLFRWRSLAKDAGHCIKPSCTLLPTETARVRFAEARWVYTLFDLAWNRRISFPMKAPKTLLKNVNVWGIRQRAKYETDEERRRLLHEADDLERQGFYSMLDDVIRASVHAIDVLIGYLEEQRHSCEEAKMMGEPAAIDAMTDKALYMRVDAAKSDDPTKVLNPSNSGDQSDQKSDHTKKPKINKRYKKKMNDHAWNIARVINATGATIKHAVEDYVMDHPKAGAESTLCRRLGDNREEWEDTTKLDQNTTN